MKLEGIPFQTIDWSAVEPTRHPGEAGVATWRTREAGNARVRMVEYSPGYITDHWCERGHVVLVLEGELITELRDGREVALPARAASVKRTRSSARSAR
jgi:quercetin dioxygenase-like cupin family protein